MPVTTPEPAGDPIDPYRLDERGIAEPPTTLLGRLSYCGPGFVLSASIVGAGELIATTLLGAKAGFATLWVILISCLVKVAVQLEFGRHTIQTGETCVAAMNRLPGPKPLGAHWTLWGWLLLQPVKFLQVGGILGGVALVLNMALPGLSTEAWCWTAAVVTAFLISVGRYSTIERTSLVLLGAFSLMTLASVGLLQWTEYAVTWPDVLSGLQGRVPDGAWIIVIGAFGLTGVGGDEIMHYTYWLLEKGYAAKAGPAAPDDPDWRRRAEGWIRVMEVDALASMAAYTVVTAAFYVLGAAVLHARGEAPEGVELVNNLAAMYTETLGPWSRNLFLAGAFVVLYSSAFSALAAWCRMYADAADKLGWVRLPTMAARRRAFAVLAWVIALSWAALYLYYKQPEAMVIWGGVATSLILLLAAAAAVDFHCRRALPQLRPGPLYRGAFWLSIAVIGGLAVWGLVKVLA